MIKVNVVTLQASRVDIPLNAKGLADRTLRYLQAELDPVPPELLNIEFWPENNVTAVIDESIEKYGTEILILDEANKIVNVSREVVPLTTEELAEKQAAIDEQNRIIELNNVVSTDTVVNNIKLMTNTEFDTWWGVNVTNAAQAIELLKRLTKLIIRKLL